MAKMTLLTIGADEAVARGPQARLLTQELEGSGLTVRFEYLPAGKLSGALLDGVIDLAFHPLWQLPANPVDAISIAALTTREDPAYALLIQPAAVAGKPLRLREGASVSVSFPFAGAQLQYFRPDLQIVHNSFLPDPTTLLQQKAVDAVLWPVSNLPSEQGDWEFVRLHPREFVPPPGQGAYALLVRTGDRTLRQRLRDFHHPEVSAVTNVERKVLRLLGGDPKLPLGVFCSRDEAENFHVWAVMGATERKPLRRVQLSSNTSHLLAERVVEELEREG